MSLRDCSVEVHRGMSSTPTKSHVSVLTAETFAIFGKEGSEAALPAQNRSSEHAGIFPDRF